MKEDLSIWKKVETETTNTKEDSSMKEIQDYLSQAGISRGHKGFHYLTCFLMVTKDANYPILNMQDLYEGASKRFHLTDEFNDIYQRCKYCIKKSNVPKTKEKSVKEFLYNAYDELFLGQ